MSSVIIEEILELKKSQCNTYATDTDDKLRVHIASNIDHFEYIEDRAGKVRAFIEWYEGRPVFDKDDILIDIEKDETALFVANIVAGSTMEILAMGRKIVRWSPKATVLYFEGRDRQKLQYKIKDRWRENG